VTHRPLIVCLLLALFPALPGLAATLVPNGSFEIGAAGSPQGWKLVGDGAWRERGGFAGKRCVAVTGKGEERACYWRTEVDLEPGATYRLRFRAKGERTQGGCIIAGLECANQDLSIPPRWTEQEITFTAPANRGHYLRLGQWNVRGTVCFDQVTLLPLAAVHLRQGAVELGRGEAIVAGQCTAEPLSEEGNCSRALAEYTAGWNTNRWRMDQGSQVTYRHDFGCAQRRASVQVTIGFYQGGECAIEASQDGQTFVPVGKVIGQKEATLPLPPALFPARVIWVRLHALGAAERKADSAPGSFQVTGYRYQAQPEGEPAELVGQTSFLQLDRTAPQFPVQVESLGSLRPETATEAVLAITADRPRTVRVAMRTGTREFAVQACLQAGGNRVSVPYSLTRSGEYPLDIRVTAGGRTLFSASTKVQVPVLLAADYGQMPASGPLPLWWCGGTYKVAQQRPLPEAKGEAVSLSAARNEYEPFQIVLRPTRDLGQVEVVASPLIGPHGAKIDPPEVRLVEYVNVAHPTDAFSSVGLWPDPLPVYRPFAARAGRNRPLWFTVYVPGGAPPGDYRGAVTIRAGPHRVQVPVRLHVWGFTLPLETHVRSGFGFSAGTVVRYENLADSPDREQTLERWYQAFRSHRMSPYTPMGSPHVDFGVVWEGGKVEAAPGRASRCLHLVDDSERVAIGSGNQRRIPVTPGGRYTFSMACRRAEAGELQATLGQYDAGGRWLSGHNIDMTFPAGTDWASVGREVMIDPKAHFVTVALRPAPWTEDGRLQGEAWFDDVTLTAAGERANLVADGGFEESGSPKVTIDWTDFDRLAAHYLDELGYNSFAMPIQGLGGGVPEAKEAAWIAGTRAGTPEYRALMADYLGQVERHLRERGWLKKAYVCWLDEPADTEESYAYVRGGMATLRDFAPGLNRFLTEKPVNQLYDWVNTWCVPVGDYTDRCRERQRQGDEIWWYLCCGPRAPFFGLFIDHPATDFRTWLWASYKYGVTGILIWETVYWSSGTAFPDSLQNPWEDPMGYVSSADLAPGTRSYWGNGDGRLWYPNNRRVGEDRTPYTDGPVPSLRVEVLREGIEDYEYLYRLEQLCKRPGAPAEAKALLKVPKDIITDLTHYSFDPAPIMRHREKVARMIERLEGGGR